MCLGGRFWEENNARGYHEGVIAINFKHGVSLSEAQTIITSLLPPVDMPMVVQESEDRDGYVAIILYVPDGQEGYWAEAFHGHPKVISSNLIYPQNTL